MSGRNGIQPIEEIAAEYAMWFSDPFPSLMSTAVMTTARVLALQLRDVDEIEDHKSAGAGLMVATGIILGRLADLPGSGVQAHSPTNIQVDNPAIAVLANNLSMAGYLLWSGQS